MIKGRLCKSDRSDESVKPRDRSKQSVSYTDRHGTPFVRSADLLSRIKTFSQSAQKGAASGVESSGEVHRLEIIDRESRTVVTVIEVLSPSTERIDRSEKFNAYIQIPTLQEYFLVEQSMMRVELFRRATGWGREVLLAGDVLRLASVEFEIAVDALYCRVEF